MDLLDALKTKLFTLNLYAWEQRAPWPAINRWLDNFVGTCAPKSDEQLNALYLLSQFMYFGSAQIRELLKAMFRDLYKYPIVAKIRKAHGDTRDSLLLDAEFKKELLRTRFLGMGNPSESGVHLLYYFRQENRLPKELFVDGARIVTRQRQDGKTVSTLREPDVRRYVYIDDICASGQQAEEYSRDLLAEVLAIDSEVELHYLCLVATTAGLDHVRTKTLFGSRAHCVFELDESYKCFSSASRYFASAPPEVDRYLAEDMARTYGTALEPKAPLGYKDGQLLLGFHHNTPDNTLPLVWFEDIERHSWVPIFRRYPKEVKL